MGGRRSGGRRRRERDGEGTTREWEMEGGEVGAGGRSENKEDVESWSRREGAVREEVEGRREGVRRERDGTGRRREGRRDGMETLSSA